MTNRSRYPIPATQHRVEYEVKGSRFIATAAYVEDVVAARSFVERVRTEFGDATHNCWAFVVGPPGNTAFNGSSDDGEPGGTAGLPILNVLLNSGVGDVAVVVTRYFGGVKLGRGGLVRAYGGSAQRVLQGVGLAERVFYVHFRVTVDYPAVEAVRRVAGVHGGKQKSEAFGVKAAFELEIPEENAVQFERDITDATGGRAEIEKQEHTRD